jgi:hypothetical protein
MTQVCYGTPPNVTLNATELKVYPTTHSFQVPIHTFPSVYLIEIRLEHEPDLLLPIQLRGALMLPPSISWEPASGLLKRETQTQLVGADSVPADVPAMSRRWALTVPLIGATTPKRSFQTLFPKIIASGC